MPAPLYYHYRSPYTGAAGAGGPQVGGVGVQLLGTGGASPHARSELIH